jgi:hypothetical protein
MDLFVVEVGCRLVSDGVFEMRKVEVLEMMRETEPQGLKWCSNDGTIQLGDNHFARRLNNSTSGVVNDNVIDAGLTIPSQLSHYRAKPFVRPRQLREIF